MSAEGSPPSAGTFADQAFSATAEAYTTARGGWEQAVHAAIAALFEFLAARAPQTSACIVADCGAGRDALASRDRTIARFVELLRPGFEATQPAPPPVVGEAIGGGIYELVRGHVLERRLGELPDAVPDATVVALSPFIGAAEAIDLAAGRNVQAGR
jgi:hypothetical protein